MILADKSGKILQYADKSAFLSTRKRISLVLKRDPSESCTTWMNQEEKAVWLKFGNPHAGKSIKEKFEKWKENWWTKSQSRNV